VIPPKASACGQMRPHKLIAALMYKYVDYIAKLPLCQQFDEIGRRMVEICFNVGREAGEKNDIILLSGDAVNFTRD
jgi:hypothetical protein